LPAQQVAELITLCWSTGDLSDVRKLIAAAVPRA